MGTRREFAVLLVALAALAASCTQRRPVPPGVRDCPLLVVGSGANQVSYGGLASTGRFAEGACVELFAASGERVAHTYAGPAGAFAFQFVVPGNADGAAFRLRVTDPASGRVDTFPAAFSATSRAEIAYTPDTTPLIATRTGLRFTGWLEPTGTSSPIGSAWLVNWSRGLVAFVSPTPSIHPSAEFTAEVGGGRGDCASILSGHLAGTGGCWWPRGGAGCAPDCTLEEFREGLCPVGGTGTCTRGRGCGVLDVTERRSAAPPPETDRTIRTLPPPPAPIDAGPPDAPIPDAPLADGEVLDTGVVF